MEYNVEGIRDKLIHFGQFYGVLELIKPVIDWNEFYLWSGSSKSIQHHYGKGGLATHTLEVVETSNMVANKYKLKFDDMQKLFLATLYHDIGKIWDYQPIKLELESGQTHIDYQEWEKAPHCGLIHHIPRSAMFFNEKCSEYKFKDDVIHCILSHHGQREWGSPISPKTQIAWILHLCDGLSARIADCGGMHV